MGKVQGEGDYRAAREYDAKVAAHAADSGKVKAEGKAARDALEGSEREALEKAEAEGRARARQ